MPDQKKSLCIFIHFSEKQYIPYYVQIFVNELARFFDEVVLLSNKKTLNPVPTLSDNVTITFQENFGYDFGRFYNYYKTIDPSEYYRIAGVNDSNILINKLDNTLKWENIVPFDFWGLVDSHEKPWFSKLLDNHHIQSHFLIFHKNAIELLDDFFKSIRIEEFIHEKSSKVLRRKIIDRCEIGLSQYMKTKGLKFGHFFDSREMTNLHNIQIDSNISHVLYEELLITGYPLIKKKVITNQCDEYWKDIIKMYGNPQWNLDLLIEEMNLMFKKPGKNKKYSVFNLTILCLRSPIQLLSKPTFLMKFKIVNQIMNIVASQIYRVLVPKPIRNKILARKLPISIRNYYSSLPEEPSEEIKTALNYLNTNPISIFPYPFQDQYKADDIKVFNDFDKGLPYVLLDGKRLYFKKRWGKQKIRQLFNLLSKEQDIQSPHRYLNEQFKIEEGDVLVDIGVAEGNFALSVVEKASRLILFEADKEWIEPLNATFEPWKDKVTIVNKYVGNRTNRTSTKLDDFIEKGENINFLKIDVDGAESKLLDGCKRILAQQKPLKVAICTYHKQSDEKDFSSILHQNGFETSHTDGFMLFYFDKQMTAPYFRRGLIRAVKS